MELSSLLFYLLRFSRTPFWGGWQAGPSAARNTFNRREAENCIFPSSQLCWLASEFDHKEEEEEEEEKNKNSITFIPPFSVIFDSKATGSSRRLRLFLSRACMGWRQKRIWSFRGLSTNPTLTHLILILKPIFFNLIVVNQIQGTTMAMIPHWSGGGVYHTIPLLEFFFPGKFAGFPYGFQDVGHLVHFFMVLRCPHCRRADLAPIHCVYALPLEAALQNWDFDPPNKVRQRWWKQG